jgi:hypothetical protein
MNDARFSAVIKATLVAAALSCGSVAYAGPSVSSPEMVKALARAHEGPTELRRFIERTKPIYNLDYTEVMTIHEVQKLAARNGQPVVANAESK